MRVTKLFPKREQVLTDDFSHFQNFFPIATIEIDEGGSTIPIHIIYTFFQATNADEQFFAEGEYGGNFSFQIVGDLCRPTLQEEALRIDEDYHEFLDKAIAKYDDFGKWYAPLDFPPQPEFWQNDDTPLSKTGEPMRFICQLDLADIVDDDCRLFIFVDLTENIIRTVYQRD